MMLRAKPNKISYKMDVYPLMLTAAKSLIKSYKQKQS